jgi:hypothetical protein
MISRLASYLIRCVAIITIIFVAQAKASQISPTRAHSDVAALEQQYPGVTDIVNKVKSAIASQNYDILKPYTQKDIYGRSLSWDDTKSDEPEELSYESMNNRLYKVSRGAKLHLTGKVSSWDIPSYVYIETQGWKGKLSHLVFLFYYKKNTNQWFWIGIDEGPLK